MPPDPRDATLLDRLSAALEPVDAPLEDLRGPFPDRAPRLAAVMVLLYPRGDETHLALELRPPDIPSHPGQISLPGGGHRPSDGDFLGTARREVHEELGVPPEAYAVWGRLRPETIRASNFAIVPFVAHAESAPSLRPDPREVAEVLEVPLALLLDPAALLEEIWEVRGTLRRVAYYRHGAHRIWG